ncbi:hypothetical protein ACFU98_35670 [Streptomyces sp. NPDC057575]|uniref:hypothetical protein n=1 Tax=unclassified Streptomyces TaxID=2593676 RepID=UPI00368F5B20
MAAFRASRASSTRTKGAALLICLLLAGCSDSQSQGKALDAEGTQSSGTVGNTHAKTGQTWYFALPVPRNVSSRPIEITGASVVDPPKGLKVVSYAAYNLNDTDGLPLLALEGESDTPDFAHLKNYAVSPVKVLAKKESEIFFQARIRITSPPEKNIKRCRFQYRQGNEEFMQILDCELELKVEQ